VTAAGGASRAAFFTGSILGVLKDITQSRPAEFHDFSKQLFAISTVSGSSLGAAYFVALSELVNEADSGNAILARAWDFGREDRQWFLADGARPTNGRATWKDAMQVLTAGDFLTPAVAAFAFRDVLPFGAPFGAIDRAIALELAWERRFESAFKSKLATNQFEMPLTAFAPGVDRWRPIMFFNGSSVETGHRIIATPIDPKVPGLKEERDPQKYSSWNILYADAYDLLDMINSEQSLALSPDAVINRARRVRRSVRLSTAALASARFPFVSPHGTITNADQVIIDRIVDGGYFESNGALTTIDIADALRRVRLVDVDERGGVCGDGMSRSGNCVSKEVVDHELEPANIFVLQISNDPEPGRCVKATDIASNSFDPSATIPMPVTSRWKVFGTLRSIVDGVASARVARGTHASEFLSYHSDDDEKGYFAWRNEANPGFVHIRVCPPGGSPQERSDLSMSWWLSHPVQSYLDEQLCEVGNLEGLSKALLVLSRKFDSAKVQEMKDLRVHYESMARTWLNCKARN
jgi:hypothetical protein